MLVWLSARTWLYVVSHHKNQRHACIPDQTLSAETGTLRELLDCLELLFGWAHARHIAAFDRQDHPDRAHLFRTAQEGRGDVSSLDMGRTLASIAQSVTAAAGLPAWNPTFNTMRCARGLG